MSSFSSIIYIIGSNKKRLDLKTHLGKVWHFEKSISSFESKSDFNKSVSLFKKYGQCEQKMLKFIYFESEEMGKNQAPMHDSLSLLEKFGLLYKTECNYTEDKCRSYFQAIFPLACTALYESSRHTTDSWTDCLYDKTRFEIYFARLDQIRLYESECKELSALRKEKMLWASRDAPTDNEFYNYYECDLSAAGSRLLDEDLDSRRVEHDIYDAEGRLTFRDEDRDHHQVKSRLEVRSPFRVTQCFFARFSAFIQPFLLDRFDWADAIVARDLNDTCIRARFNSDANPRLVVEIKAKRDEHMSEMKTQLLQVLDDLESYYPGLYYFKYFHFQAT